MTLYEVAVAAPLYQTLTYAAPGGGDREPEPGIRVLVPLGNRLVTGYLLGPAPDTDRSGFTIRKIVELLDPEPLFPPSLVPFFRWIADYYLYPPGEVIRTALPGGLTACSGRRVVLTGRGRAELPGLVKEDPALDTDWVTRLLARGELPPAAVLALWRSPARQRLLSRWAEQGLVLIEDVVTRDQVRARTVEVVEPGPVLAPVLAEDPGPDPDHVLQQLSRRGPDLKKSEQRTLRLFLELWLGQGGRPVPRPELRRQYPNVSAPLAGLCRRRLLTLRSSRVYRDPFGNRPPYLSPPEHLTGEQEQVLAELLPAIEEPRFATFLLFGTTGSGKTEVYLRASEAALARGRSVLVLVPEIALASQLEAHFYSRFGDRLAVLHSGLSPGERLDQWQQIMAGRARIVIGARSAVFAPLADPGLIIVDEEHEPAYKQDDGLRYSGRDLAVLRGSMAGCPVLLGSATPSVTSFHHASSGKYRLLTMASRVRGRALPEVEVVDLARQKRSRPDLFFSDRLISALRETMERREQSLLFVNRRGFSSFMLCRDCGHIVGCSHCQVSLTMHRQLNRLVCHYCGYSLPPNLLCPGCGSDRVVGLGLGSERIEEEVRQLLPHARVARLDSDTATSRKKYLAILKAVRERDVDILVGTQMIAKGLHFPHITLVGVVWADSGLGMPDYKASERTFSLLSQVTGRAGRGEQPGRVIIQTHQPEHYAIRHARDHDYLQLYEREIELRRELGYPPFVRLVNIRLSARDEEQLGRCAEQVAAFLRRGATGMPVILLGPAPAPLARLRDRSRWQLLLKSRDAACLRRLCRLLLAKRKKLCPTGVRMAIDVDPENMM